MCECQCTLGEPVNVKTSVIEMLRVYDLIQVLCLRMNNSCQNYIHREITILNIIIDIKHSMRMLAHSAIMNSLLLSDTNFVSI